MNGDAMTAPRTILDERFSDAGAEPTDWDSTLGALEAAELFWLSTVRVDGRPHVTPLVAVWTEDRLHFCTGAEEQKALNLRHHPHVVLTTGCNTWDEGLDVMVEGKAVQVTDYNTLCRLAEAWTTKWDRTLAIRSGRRRFFAPRGSRASMCFRGRARQGPGLRQGAVHAHFASVLTDRRASVASPRRWLVGRGRQM
jgi:general stress protein 26